MTVSVEKERYLGVACGDGEQIVFDRTRDEFHLLRGIAARIWEAICDGGTFSISDIGAPETMITEECATALREMERAELIRIDLESDLKSEAMSGEEGETKIDRRAWISLTGRAAAVATVLPFVMTLVAPKPGLAVAKRNKFSLGHPDNDVSPFDKDHNTCSSHRKISTHHDPSNHHNNNWWEKGNDETNRNDVSNNNNNQHNWWDKSNNDQGNNLQSSNQHPYNNRNDHSTNQWWGR